MCNKNQFYKSIVNLCIDLIWFVDLKQKVSRLERQLEDTIREKDDAKSMRDSYRDRMKVCMWILLKAFLKVQPLQSSSLIL